MSVEQRGPGTIGTTNTMTAAAAVAPAAIAGESRPSRGEDEAVVFPFGEPDARLEDFLDDKLQSAADLDTVGELLAGAEAQQVVLQAQLEGAAAALAAAQNAAADQDAALGAQLAEFAALEQAVGSRLAAVRSSDAPEAVVQRLQQPMGQLRRVSTALRYLQLLADVAAWAAAAREALPADPHEALEPYGRLRQLGQQLVAQAATEAADGNGNGNGNDDYFSRLHVTSHVTAVADSLWADMNRTMRAELEAVLAQRRWPQVDAAVRADETWRAVFAKLVDLQAPEILARAEAAAVSSSSPSSSSSSPSSSPSLPLPLLPVDVMAQIFVKEFRYHFLSSRRTADPRQTADVCFPWLLDRVAAWADFLRDSFADILAARFSGTAADAALTSLYADPACALVAALLPVMREKVALTVAFAVEQLEEQKKQQQQQQQQQQKQQFSDTQVGSLPFLCGFIVQLHAFDDELRTRFGYDGGYIRTTTTTTTTTKSSTENTETAKKAVTTNTGWPGLAADVLHDHFGQWLQAEKENALARYRSIVEAADGHAIDYDYSSSSGGGGRTTAMATAAAAVTVAHSKPTLAAERVMDLLQVVTGQYRRVRRFAHRLRFLVDIQATILDAYDDRLRGSLEAYAAMTSAVGRTLHGVTRDQLATLEGTGALETLCRVYGSADYVINTLQDVGDDEFFIVLWEELQTRAAAVTGGDQQPGRERSFLRAAESTTKTGEGDGSGALFDETIAAFSQRRKAAQDFLVAALADSHRKAFRPYVLRTQWTTVAEGAAGSGVVDPADLAITAELDEPLRVIRRNLDFLSQALGTAALRRVVRGALEKLQELLWSEVLAAQTFSALGAAQLARDVGAVAALAEQYVPRSAAAALEGLREGLQLLNLPVAADSKDAITLQEATDRVFTDNTEAKKVLQALGLNTLTPANARLILQRRVESNA